LNGAARQANILPVNRKRSAPANEKGAAASAHRTKAEVPKNAERDLQIRDIRLEDTDSKEEKNKMDINKLKETIRAEIERGQYSLMNDELFGYVFGREERKDLTAEFLSAALEKDFGHPITGISFMPPMELPVHGDRDLVSRIAARCELGDEEHIFAELQLVNYMESRELPLACCAMMIEAQPEYDLHPCATVSIVSYSLLRRKTWHSDCHIRSDQTFELMDNRLGLHFLEVPVFAKEERKPVSEMTWLERWMEFFSNRLSDEEKKELSEVDPAIGRAYAAAEGFFNESGNVRKYIEREAELRLALADLRAAGLLG
jgi:hypothetical protein